jgi:hypothetical protein
MGELVSQREYSRRRNISHTAVRQRITKGQISTVGPKKMIDPKVADQEWEDHTDPSKPRNRLTGSPKARRQAGEPEQPMEMGGGGTAPGNGKEITYQQARTARETYKAAEAKLELDERVGRLVDANKVKMAAFDAARTARDSLMAMPERMARVLHAAQSPDEVQQLLEDAIERICEELSGGNATRE